MDLMTPHPGRVIGLLARAGRRAGKPALASALALAVLALSGCFGGQHKQVGAEMLDEKVTAERIENALKTNPGYSFPNVRVQVAGQTVTLSGSVNTAAQNAKAVALAKSVHRFKDLRDEIEVQPGT